MDGQVGGAAMMCEASARASHGLVASSNPIKALSKVYRFSPLATKTLIIHLHVSSTLHTSAMGEKFPEVQGGGSLILAWQVRNKKVLVIGGGEVWST